MKDVLKLALEALERADKISGYANNRKTITAIKEAHVHKNGRTCSSSLQGEHMSRISWNTFLASMLEIGHRDYIETTLENYAQVMRTVNTPKSRRPKEMKDMEFTTTLMTAVGSKAGDIRYLVCIERIK